MLKKFLLATVVAGTMLMSATPAFANVVRNAQGQPIGAESNTGSAQGQANRSTNGTQMKITHDGYINFM